MSQTCTLLNFGDNTRVIHNITNQPVIITTGAMASVTLAEAAVKLMANVNGNDTLVMVPPDIELPDDFVSLMNTLATLHTIPYDQMVSNVSVLLGRDALKLRPSVAQVRVKLRDVAMRYARNGFTGLDTILGTERDKQVPIKDDVPPEDLEKEQREAQRQKDSHANANRGVFMNVPKHMRNLRPAAPIAEVNTGFEQNGDPVIREPLQRIPFDEGANEVARRLKGRSGLDAALDSSSDLYDPHLAENHRQAALAMASDLPTEAELTERGTIAPLVPGAPVPTHLPGQAPQPRPRAAAPPTPAPAKAPKPATPAKRTPTKRAAPAKGKPAKTKPKPARTRAKVVEPARKGRVRATL